MSNATLTSTIAPVAPVATSPVAPIKASNSQLAASAIYYFGDSLQAFARRNELATEGIELASVTVKVFELARDNKRNEARKSSQGNLVKASEKGKWSKDGWLVETVLTYRRNARQIDSELCETAFEKSKAQSARRVSRMAGDLMELVG
jgi:hypothetical protein